MVRPWWVLAARGSLALAFAFSTVMLPVALAGLLALFGGYALLDGATELVVARARYHASRSWLWLTLVGGSGIAIGLVALIFASVATLPADVATALISAWAVARGLAGVLDVVVPFRAEKRQHPDLSLPLPSGLGSLLFGLSLLLLPGDGGLAGIVWIGAFAMVSGLLQLARAVVQAQGEQAPFAVIVPTAAELRAVPLRWRDRLHAPR
jgi:uncharacterized membrane protein HdeD (DUF308 family)